jgi:hypothetical protein
MMTYSKASQKSIQAAISKARQVKPRVTVVSYGKFEVCGSKGDCYTVQFTADSAGGLVVICGCKGSQNGRPCYHGASAAGAYKLQWSEKRAAATAAPAPADYVFLSEEEIASGQWGEPMTEQQAIAAGKCAKKWCDRLAEAGAYCDECALELAHDRACLFG